MDPFYGYAFDQLTSLGITHAHNLGITGDGVRIGILDTGFKSSLSIFEKIRDEGRLIAERDFIHQDKSTEDEEEDGESGMIQTHGTGVWSVIGAYAPGELVGELSMRNLCWQKPRSSRPKRLSRKIILPQRLSGLIP